MEQTPQWATTKAEFIELLERQFSHMLNNVVRRVSAEVKGHRGRTSDNQSFADWLRAEHARATAEPALRTFDNFMKYETPRQAAEELAGFIEKEESHVRDDARQTIVFDLSRVDWKEQHRLSLPVLAGLPDAEGKAWKYRGLFSPYIKAAKADARARELDRHLTELAAVGKPTQAKPEPRVRAMAFYLFYSNPADRSKDGIKRAGEELGCNANTFYNEWCRVLKADYRRRHTHLVDLRTACKMLAERGHDTATIELDISTAEQQARKK